MDNKGNENWEKATGADASEEIADDFDTMKGEEPAEEGFDSEDASKLRAKNEELVNDLKRLQAEFENYQKRTDKEKAVWEEKGKRTVLMKLILLADEFEAAGAHMHQSSESELRSGIRLLQKKLLAVLEEEGVKPIECLGKKFDPGSCDAVEMVGTEGDEGIVAKEMRKGYVYNGSVLRHAMVGVSKKKEGESEGKKE